MREKFLIALILTVMIAVIITAMAIGHIFFGFDKEGQTEKIITFALGSAMAVVEGFIFMKFLDK